MMQFWRSEIKCARCEAVADCDAAQRVQDGTMQGALADGWTAVVFSERMPAIATTPQQAVVEKVRYRAITFPCCSEKCAMELTLERAIALCRTKEQQAEFIEHFEAFLGKHSGGKKK
jgi:hypothetical protein